MRSRRCIFRSEFESCQYELRLDKMVMLMRNCFVEPNHVSEAEFLRVWRDLKVTLLLWALEYRAWDMEDSYLQTFPIACIGEPVVIWDPSISEVASGHLSNWVEEKDGWWRCELLADGQRKKMSISLLATTPVQFTFGGEIGLLQQDLVQVPAGDRYLTLQENVVCLDLFRDETVADDEALWFSV